MKIIYGYITISILSLWLNGCGLPSRDLTVSPLPSESQIEVKKPQKKRILTTFTVLADIGRNVAGDKAIVESLTKPGAEIHGYEPTPSDLVKAQTADLILDNGLGFERWAERFYTNLGSVPHLTASEGIQPIAIAEGEYKNKSNPHAWMSPKNALIYVENIRKALVKLDSLNANVYNFNAEAYSAKIKVIDQKLRKALAVIPSNKRFMITCEGAFSYLTRDYQLREGYLWAVNSDQQVAPKQVQKMIEFVKANQVPAVFCESTVSDKFQRQVASEGNSKFGGVFFVDSLSSEDGVAPTYLKLLEYNVDTLIKGLQD